MKKVFAYLFVLIFVASSFANVRLDSMLLQNGELKDVIGDYFYSPTFFPDQNMVIYVGNSDNIYSKTNNVFTETNNTISTDDNTNTADIYMYNVLFLLRLKRFVFGLNYNPVFQSGDIDTINKIYVKMTSSYFINAERNTTISNNANNFNFSAGMDMGLFNIALRLGMISGKDTETDIFRDFNNSANDTVYGFKYTAGGFIISPDVLFKLSFGRILGSFNIVSVSNKGEENFDGTNYLSSYKETGLNFLPKFFYNNKFSFGSVRCGFTLGTQNLKRKYTYDPSLAENTWDYSDKSSGITSFVTFTKYYKISLITGGFRVLTSKVTQLYKFDPDTSNTTTYEDFNTTGNSSKFGLILAFEQHLNGFITFFGGVNWDALNNMTTNTLLKDETGAVVSNKTEKTKTPVFHYGVGLSIRFWNIGSLNFSFSNIAKGYGKYDDNIDELALNNTNTSNEKNFTFYFDFLR